MKIYGRSLRCISSLTLVVSLHLLTSAFGSSDTSLILRVRLSDGSVQRLSVPDPSKRLGELVTPLKESPMWTVHQGSNCLDETQTVESLGLTNGALLTLSSSSSAKLSHGLSERSTKPATTSARYNPYPDLAKDYDTAYQQQRRKRSSRSLSYQDLAHLQSALHLVEAQPTGPMLRIYMCRISAERFQSNKSNMALLLGSISRERVDPATKFKAKTSLSSTTADSEYCWVAKTQAIWEAPQVSALQQAMTAQSRVRRVAQWLGLQPIGWIFSYDQDRHDNDALPVWSRDIQTAASLQIQNMQIMGSHDGSRFVTLALDGRTGATEAFQLSDVTVQMVSEDMFDEQSQTNDVRHIQTKHPVIVDGKESHQLDSVLCLVNTAMLSFEGALAGKTTNSVKKNRTLTAKTRKTILKAIDKEDEALLKVLSDFHALLALDELLEPADSEQLCAAVQKWTRGQKKGTVVEPKLKKKLKLLLESQV